MHKTQLIDVFSGKSTIEYFTNEDKEMMERYKIASQPVPSLAERVIRERDAHEKTMELRRLYEIASKSLSSLSDIRRLHEPMGSSRRQYKAAELLNKQILAKEIISPVIQLKIEKEKNEQLEKENAQLKKENAQLNQQLHEYQSREQLLEPPHEYNKDTLEQQNISQYMSQIGEKGNATRGATKRKIIAHFQREHAETNISKNQFADKYHATYHRTRDTVRNILKGI